jgi:hypothetical protein
MLHQRAVVAAEALSLVAIVHQHLVHQSLLLQAQSHPLEALNPEAILLQKLNQEALVLALLLILLGALQLLNPLLEALSLEVIVLQKLCREVLAPAIQEALVLQKVLQLLNRPLEALSLEVIVLQKLCREVLVPIVHKTLVPVLLEAIVRVTTVQVQVQIHKALLHHLTATAALVVERKTAALSVPVPIPWGSHTQSSWVGTAAHAVGGFFQGVFKFILTIIVITVIYNIIKKSKR